jgi:transcription elongation factor GreB
VHAGRRTSVDGVSKAFTKDDDAAPPVVVPRRAPLPAGQPNYVTPRGLALLRAELSGLRAEQALHGTRAEGAPDAALLERLAELEERLATAEVVPLPSPPPAEARFGATVTVVTEAGVERTYTIVGVDEADAAAGRLAFVAPLSRALLGKRAGDVATVRTPHGNEELEILRVRYESPA